MSSKELRKNTELYFIGVDVGFGTIKASYMTRPEEAFPAGVRLDGGNSSILESDKCLEFQGRKYLYGTEVETMLRDKSQNEDMIIQVLACIAREIKAKHLNRCLHVALGIGMPLKVFGDQILRNSYIEYFTKKYQTCSFRSGGESYEVVFDYVKCFPQAYAVYKVWQKELTDPEYTIIDIGSNTVDALKVVNGRISENSIHTNERGVNHLLNEIVDELSGQQIRISRESISFIIHGGTLRHMKADLIKECCRAHADRFIQELIANLRMKYDLQLPVIWIGGGYQFMKYYIKNIPDILTVREFDTFANAAAYERLVRAGYAKDLKR